MMPAIATLSPIAPTRTLSKQAYGATNENVSISLSMGDMPYLCSSSTTPLGWDALDEGSGRWETQKNRGDDVRPETYPNTQVRKHQTNADQKTPDEALANGEIQMK